ncbi:MAG: response regulator [Lachnospiraceae bacterium]
MYRLLIAEDELIERMALKKTLQKKLGETCAIYEAENGKEAVKIFRREDIQIVILDIAMPGINGIQAAEMMRTEKKECCLIFLTAYDRFEYAKKAIYLRALDYLLKPYSIKELMSVVEEAMHLTAEWERKRKEIKGETPAAAEHIEDRSVMEEPENEAETVSRLSVMTAMVEEYIRKNYMNEISMSDGARAINYSEPYFCKMFKQQFGQNFTSYLAEYRIEEARKLLGKPNINVKEVGARVGYPDSNYFTKVFHRMTGQNPSEYRMTVLQNL